MQNMFKPPDFLKAKLGEISAKTISLGGKRFTRGRNEQKVRDASLILEHH
jgi:hypothetical protein